MKRVVAILTIAAAAICVVSLILVLVSKWLQLPNFSGRHHEVVDPHASFSIGYLHCAISRGRIWFFNSELPYTGSIIGLEGTWGGRPTTNRKDWSWVVGRFGIEQVSHIDNNGESAGKAQYCDFPGVYYRYFDWWNEELSLWTLAVSLWYPAALSATLPSWWVVRRVGVPRQFSLQTLFVAVTLLAVALGCTIWLKS